MKKVCRIDVDCPNCAAKIEDAVRNIAGVEKVSVSVIMQKMTIVAASEDMSNILREAEKLVRRVDEDACLYVE